MIRPRRDLRTQKIDDRRAFGGCALRSASRNRLGSVNRNNFILTVMAF